MATRTRVFVYGTLKTGQPNYFRIERALKEGTLEFVGKARTQGKFPLIIAGRYNLPYFLYAKGTGNQIQGEVYDVDDKTLREFDALEEIPDHYQVEHLTVDLLSTNKTPTGGSTECLIYVCKKYRPEMLERPFYSDYDAYGNHGLLYSTLHSDVGPEYRYDVIVRPQET